VYCKDFNSSSRSYIVISSLKCANANHIGSGGWIRRGRRAGEGVCRVIATRIFIREEQAQNYC
jgi:hypothetical protein